MNDQLVSKIKTILNQNIKIDSKHQLSEASKPFVVSTGTHGMTKKNQNVTFKVAVVEDSNLNMSNMSRGSAPLPVALKIITVRAKLVSPSVLSPLLTNKDDAHPEALGEKLRKRLI